MVTDKTIKKGLPDETSVKVGYKQTEIGVIPEDWSVKNLGEIADVVTGNTPPTNDQSNYGEDYFFVSPADLGKNKYISQTQKKLSKKGFSISRKFPPNSILFTCIGSTIGKAGITLFELTSNQQINAILPNKNYSSDFLFYSLNLIAPKIKSLAGEQAVPIVNKCEFEKTTIALPPNTSEQTAIATVLSDTDALIERLEKLIAKKKAIKQGAMQQLLTGKKRLPGFSGEWEVERLDEIFSITAGRDLIKESYSQIRDDDHPFPIYSNSLENRGLYGYTGIARHKENSITITARGTIGRANARDHKFDAIGRLLVLEPKKELNCFFISEYLNNKVVFSIESTGVPQLTSPQASKYLVIYPNPVEQTAIATILSDMDAEIENLEQKKDKYIMLKQGMMQQLLTGRIRIYANN